MEWVLDLGTNQCQGKGQGLEIHKTQTPSYSLCLGGGQNNKQFQNRGAYTKEGDAEEKEQKKHQQGNKQKRSNTRSVLFSFPIEIVNVVLESMYLWAPENFVFLCFA